MMLFIIFVALIGLLFLIASLFNGINFPLLSAALFFFTGSAVLYAARRSRNSQKTSVSDDGLRNMAGGWLPDPRRFLLAMSVVAYGLAALSLFGQFVPNPESRGGQLLKFIFYKFGPIGLVMFFASIGTGLLIASIHRSQK